MKTINYDNRKFVPVENSAGGEVSNQTIFHYHQKGDLVWAEYAGGEIVFGNLIAKIIEGDLLDMRYHHLNTKGELMTGKGVSKPEITLDGRIRLYEKWQWTCADYSSGESVVEEL